MKVCTEVHFCAAHRLYKYVGACSQIHGHNYKVVVAAEYDKLNDLGLGIDFKTLKREAQNLVDQLFDHKLVLCTEDPLVDSLKNVTPIFLMNKNPTAENMALLIADELFSFVQVPVIVQVWETPTSFAEVVYYG